MLTQQGFPKIPQTKFGRYFSVTFVSPQRCWLGEKYTTEQITIRIIAFHNAQKMWNLVEKIF
jgi:hypothetical protein